MSFTNREIIYLACPYSHPDINIRIARFRAANEAAFSLIQKGRIVYSPISHSHSIEAVTKHVQATEYWLSFDEAFMDVCSELVVLKLPGWKESKGVTHEIAYFKQQGKPVSYMEAV
jgi:Domain of unknown function (DUF1937)